MTASRVLREVVFFLLVAVPSGVAGLAFATFALGIARPERIWYDAVGALGYGLALAVRSGRSRAATRSG